MPLPSGSFLSLGEITPSGGKPFVHAGPRTYQRKFLVRVSDKRMGPVEVCQCPGLPLPYAPYVVDPQRGESDLRALCVGIGAEPANKKPGEWGLWEVTHDYSSDLGSGQGITNTGFPNDRGNGAENNPEFEPPDIEWDFQELSRAFLTDLDGKPYNNTAHRPLTPAPQIEIAYPVLNITRNELSFDRRKATDFAYALNGNFFLQTPPNGAQCLPPRATIKYKGGLSYWRVSYKIRFGVVLPDDTFLSWQPEFNDNGMEEWVLKPGAVANPLIPNDADRFEWRPIKKGTHKVSSPVLLDGAGKELKPVKKIVTVELPSEPGEPPEFGQEERMVMEPVKLTFRAYKRADFTDLFVRGLGGD